LAPEINITLYFKTITYLFPLVLLLSCNEDIAVNPDNELIGTWIEKGADIKQYNGFIIERDSIYAIWHYGKNESNQAEYYVWAKGTYFAIQDTVANNNLFSFAMNRLNSPANYEETYNYTIGKNTLTLTSSAHYVPRILRKSEIVLVQVNNSR